MFEDICEKFSNIHQSFNEQLYHKNDPRFHWTQWQSFFSSILHGETSREIVVND